MDLYAVIFIPFVCDMVNKGEIEVINIGTNLECVKFKKDHGLEYDYQLYIAPIKCEINQVK